MSCIRLLQTSGQSWRRFVFVENLLSTLIRFCRISFRLKRGQAGFEI